MKRGLVLVLSGLILVSPVMAGLFRVWVHQDVIRLGYELSVAEKERQSLVAEVEQLQIEFATAKSPDRLVKAAEKLKMQRPPSDAVLGITFVEDEAQSER